MQEYLVHEVIMGMLSRSNEGGFGDRWVQDHQKDVCESKPLAVIVRSAFKLKQIQERQKSSPKKCTDVGYLAVGLRLLLSW